MHVSDAMAAVLNVVWRHQIRYHSAYPWHDKGEYRHLMAPGDDELEHWVKLFNKYDLYTKDQDNSVSADSPLG